MPTKRDVYFGLMLFAIVGAIAGSAFAIDRARAAGTTASPSAADVRAALAARGIVVGAGTTIRGEMWKIERLAVSVQGADIVVRMRPRRMVSP